MYPDLSSFEQFPAHSRVWLYQTDRPLNTTEIAHAEDILTKFVEGWKAHGAGLKAGAEIINPYFAAIVVDEQQALASGCSIDASVGIIKKLGADLKVDFLTRMKVTLFQKNEIMQEDFQTYFNGTYQPTDYIYDPLVSTLEELRRWPIPLNQSSFAHLVEGVH
jgi:hypothetical protein